MSVEYRDLAERAEKLLRNGSCIDDLAKTQKTVYVASHEVRKHDERAGDILGILAYRLRKKMQLLYPKTWLSYL